MKVVRQFLMVAGLALAGVASANGEKVVASDVLSVVTADWNGDGSMDRALLVANHEADMADLLLYLGNADNTMTLALNKKALVWKGALWGTLPSLALSGKESLLIKSANDAIGRNRWSQTLTVAYRNQAFVMAGYTYNEYDTLEPNAKGTQCDVNLLTGKGSYNGKAITRPTKAPLLNDWNEEGVIKECQP